MTKKPLTSSSPKAWFVENYYFELTLTPRSQYPRVNIIRPLLPLLGRALVVVQTRQAYSRYLSYISDVKQAPFDLIVRYANEYYINWGSLTPYGQSAWLYACGRAVFLSTPLILDSLLRAGCNAFEVDERGWNCLFHCVLEAQCRKHDKELQVLIHLLQLFDDISAKDNDGMTVFDHVRDTSDPWLGSYRRDLWTTALARAGYEYAEPSFRPAVYTDRYWPEYHLGLRYPGSWDAYPRDREVLEHLRCLARTSWSLNRDVLKILAHLQSFRSNTSIFQSYLTTPATVRVMGTPKTSRRLCVVVARGNNVRSNGEQRGRGRITFFRTVTTARCSPRRRGHASDNMAIKRRCYEILKELEPRIESEIRALEDLQSHCERPDRAMYLESLRHFSHVSSDVFVEDCFDCYLQRSNRQMEKEKRRERRKRS